MCHAHMCHRPPLFLFTFQVVLTEIGVMRVCIFSWHCGCDRLAIHTTKAAIRQKTKWETLLIRVSHRALCDDNCEWVHYIHTAAWLMRMTEFFGISWIGQVVTQGVWALQAPSILNHCFNVVAMMMMMMMRQGALLLQKNIRRLWNYSMKILPKKTAGHVFNIF